ncbi:orotate phosphoribosyltransferase [candidate division KSB1 bacterium]|nr:orotate phosphoribosyltransferase [candidate division KSB1 bacterium]
MLSKQEILSVFKETGALLNGHFLLSSGLHSPQYFQCAKVLQYPWHAERLCGEIANYFSDSKVDVVVAPAIGGIVVAQEVGRPLRRRAIFAEREGGKMTLRRGFEIRKGERALVVEDVTTTGGSALEVMNAVREMGGDVVGFGCLVDRSGGKAKFDIPTFSLIKMDVRNYSPEDCPLCQQGIELVKPGSRKISES